MITTDKVEERLMENIAEVPFSVGMEVVGGVKLFLLSVLYPISIDVEQTRVHIRRIRDFTRLRNAHRTKQIMESGLVKKSSFIKEAG